MGKLQTSAALFLAILMLVNCAWQNGAVAEAELVIAAIENDVHHAGRLFQDEQTITAVTKTDALIAAAKYGNMEMVKLLLDKGATDDAKRNAFVRAATGNRIRVLELFLANGVDVNSHDDDSGSTALHWATSNSNGALVSWLLSHGSDINSRDLKGKTPLMIAALSDSQECATVLLRRGADVNAVDNQGMSALSKAIESHKFDVANLLRNGGSQPTKSDIRTGREIPALPALGQQLSVPHYPSDLLKGLRVALLNPVLAILPCRAEAFLVSLPDEMICKNEDGWLFMPSLTILSPSDMLLVSLRYAGLSAALAPSLSEAKRAGARMAIMPVLMCADVKIMEGGNRQKGDNEANHVVATVAFQLAIVDLETSNVLWRGHLQQSVENDLMIPWLHTAQIIVEAGAGSGQYEMQAYAMRSLLVQAYTFLGQPLAHQIQTSFSKRVR